MSQVFINLPVKDLKRSIAFFEALGFRFDRNFTNDDAAGMIIDDGHSYAMLLTHKHFKNFIKNDIADPSKVTQVLVALKYDSREAVDEVVRKAVEAGGKDAREPQDLDFMYGRAFADPDGHIWEPFWMDPGAVPAGA
jgi:predicted lactoylglutathione lyase